MNEDYLSATNDEREEFPSEEYAEVFQNSSDDAQIVMPEQEYPTNQSQDFDEKNVRDYYITNANENKFDKQRRIAEAQLFFDSLYGKVSGDFWGYLWTATQDNRHKTFPFLVTDADQRAQMAKRAIELSDAGNQVYFGVNLVSVKPSPYERGKNSTVTIQVAVICDIDIVGGTHKQGDGKIYAPDFDTAKSFLPFTTSIIVNSGYGLHAYLIFAEPLNITDENRQAANRRNVGFIKLIRNRAGDYGKTADGVGDLARVLRVPGTFNYKLGIKNDSPLCRIVDVNDVRFTTNELDEQIAALTPKQPPSDNPPSRFEKNDRNELDKPTEQERAIAMLPFIKIGNGDHDRWVHVGMILKANGNDLSDWERWSATQPNYTPDKHGYSCAEKWATFPETCAMTIATLHDWAVEGGYSEKEFQRDWYAQHPESESNVRRKKQRNIPPELKLTAEQREILFSGDASDDDFAQRLVYMFGDKFRYLQESDEWIIYTVNKHGGGIWKNGGQKNSALYPFANELARKLSPNAQTKHDDEIAAKLKSTKKKSTAIAALKGVREVIITPEDLDTHNNLLNVLNGVVDLETGKLYRAAPELLLTQQARACYQQGYRNEIVDGFLRSILPDEETLAGLLRFLGYAATGMCSEEKALFCNGGGGNGKGTLTKTLMHLFGDYAATLKSSAVLLMSKTQDAGAATTELNPLEKCRVAIIEELPQGGRLDVAKFKNLTGSDLIPARKLRQEQINIEPHFSPILSGNYLPELSDTRDPGLKRRLLNITFDQTFTGKERDPNLKSKLSTDEALSGLLSLVVAEAISWYKHGLIISSAMEQATKDYLEENDFIAEFISEHCIRDARLSIPRKDFLDRLKNGDYAAECMKQFGNNDRALTSAIRRIEGIEYRRSMRGGGSGGYMFIGIGWSNAPKQGTLDQGQQLTKDELPPF